MYMARFIEPVDPGTSRSGTISVVHVGNVKDSGHISIEDASGHTSTIHSKEWIEPGREPSRKVHP
jgi:hypothetical protein